MTDDRKPYVPMVGDVIDVRVRVTELGGPTIRTKVVGCDSDYPITFTREEFAHATLVSRPEKPLQVGEPVRVSGIAIIGEVVSVFDLNGVPHTTAAFSGMDRGGAGFLTAPSTRFRRAPEGT